MLKLIQTALRTSVYTNQKYTVFVDTDGIISINEGSELRILGRTSYIQCFLHHEIFLVKKDFMGNKLLIDLGHDFKSYEFNTMKDDTIKVLDRGILNKTFNDNFTKEYLGLFDYFGENYIWRTEHYFNLLNCVGHRVFTATDVFLNCIDQNYGSTIWQTDLSAYKWSQFDGERPAEIRQIIASFNNQLLIWMAGNQLISIDIATGQILWHLTDFLQNFPNEWNSDWWYWHIEEGKLFLLKHQQYFSIDLGTKHIQLLWHNSDKSLSITHCTYTPDAVYFTACFDTQIQPSVLGIFNRRTLTVDWLEQTDILQRHPYHSFNQPPQVDKNRVYFLDSAGTLHIFKRTNT